MKRILAFAVVLAPCVATAQSTPRLPTMNPNQTFWGDGDLVHPAAGYRDDERIPAIMAVDTNPSTQQTTCIRSFMHYDTAPEYWSGHCLLLPTDPKANVMAPSIDGDAMMSWMSDAGEAATCVMKGNPQCMAENTVTSLGPVVGELDYSATVWEANNKIHFVQGPMGSSRFIAEGTYPTINQNPCWYAYHLLGIDYETCRKRYFERDLIAFEDLYSDGLIITDGDAHWRNLSHPDRVYSHPNAEQMYVAYEVVDQSRQWMEVWNPFTDAVIEVPTNENCKEYLYPVLGGPDARFVAYLGHGCKDDGIAVAGKSEAEWALYVSDLTNGDVWFVDDLSLNSPDYLPGGAKFQSLPFSFATTFHLPPDSRAVLAYSVKAAPNLRHKLVVTWPYF